MPEKWTISRVLAWTGKHFEKMGIRTSRLDAELIIAHALEMDRVALYTQSEKPLLVEERDKIKEFINRRLNGEPVAYITGVKEFWGLTFHVNPDVLVPRPETEEIVEEVRVIYRQSAAEPLRFVDLGTGSGCLAVALCAVFENATGVGVDIVEPALEVARRNADELGFSDRIDFRLGDFFDALETVDAPFDLVVGNPPYVPTTEIRTLAPEVRSETRTALDGGDDGLELVRRIVRDASCYMKPGGWILLEVGAGQDDEVADIDGGSDIVFKGFRKDLAGIDRVARWQKAGL